MNKNAEQKVEKVPVDGAATFSNKASTHYLAGESNKLSDTVNNDLNTSTGGNTSAAAMYTQQQMSG